MSDEESVSFASLAGNDFVHPAMAVQSSYQTENGPEKIICDVEKKRMVSSSVYIFIIWLQAYILAAKKLNTNHKHNF